MPGRCVINSMTDVSAAVKSCVKCIHPNVAPLNSTSKTVSMPAILLPLVYLFANA